MIRVLIPILMLLSSCSGYKLKINKNPFFFQGIKTVAIPMFVNHSILPSVNGHFAKEFSLLLSRFSGLRIFLGDKNDADAILLGIVESSDFRKEVVKTRNPKFTTGLLQSSIGSKRNQFYLPLTSRVSLKLRVILIKRPTPQLVKVVTSKMGKYLKRHPKIIFNRVFNLNHTFTRSLYDTLSVDRGGVVNYTKNSYFLDDSVAKMAKLAVVKFNEEIINAF
ncbi:MAG: hypothetical protein E2O68_03765 [Deltaproteobacteria bacterium]|nr:MAG: hypothetical protein E2O68_03765 [Deltaproteobacteria bacterium]